jgi:hypothetical protein
MGQARKAHRFGELGTPVVLRSAIELALAYPGATPAEAERREHERVDALIARHMSQLFDYYQLSESMEDPFRWLAFALAADHFPGCRVYGPGCAPRAKGRPVKWRGALGVELYLAVKKNRPRTREGNC